MKFKFLVTGVLLLPLLFFMSSCGNNEGKKEETAKAGYFFYIQKDYSQSKDRVISLHLYNPVGGDRVIDEGGKIKKSKDENSGYSYYTTGLGDANLLEETDFENGGTSFRIKGPTGVAYVKNGDLYLYKADTNEKKRVTHNVKLRDLRTDHSSSTDDIIRITVIEGEEENQYYLNLASGNRVILRKDGDFVGSIEAPVVVGNSIKGFLYQYATTPGTSPNRWRFYDYSLKISSEISPATGYDYYGFDVDNLYFSKIGVNQDDEYFYRKIIYVNKSDLPDVTSDTVKKNGSSYEYRVTFKDLLEITDTTNISFIFSNYWYYVGSHVSTPSECTSENKFECYYLYAMRHVVSGTDDYYVVEAKVSLHSWTAEDTAIYNPRLQFTSSEGMIVMSSLDRIEDGKTVRHFTLQRINNGEISDILTLNSSQLSDVGELDPGNFKVITGGIYQGNLYYAVKGRFNVEYDGDPKPYPSHFNFVPYAHVVERGNVNYEGENEYCEGDYTIYSDNTTSITGVECYFDENHNGIFDDTGDIECTDDDNNGQFDAGECDFVNSGRFYKTYLCSTPLDSSENGICTNSIFEFIDNSSRSIGFINNYIYVEGDSWFGTPFLYDIKSGEQSKTGLGIFDLDYFPYGSSDGMPAGWFITYDSRGIAFYDDENNKSLFDITAIEPDVNEKVRAYFAAYNGTIGILIHSYPSEKEYPYETTYTEEYSFYTLHPDTMKEEFSKTSISNGHSKAIEIELLESGFFE